MKLNFFVHLNQSIYVVLSITFILGAYCSQSVMSLKCYQCTTNDRLPCDDRYLRDCPTDQAYDMCSVVLKKQAGQLHVTRKCVLGPCTLRDHEIHGILQLREQCDMNRPDYNCIYCCRGDGCNRDSAVSSRLHQMAAMSALLALCFTFRFRY